MRYFTLWPAFICFFMVFAVAGCQPSTAQVLAKQCVDTSDALGMCEGDGYFTSQVTIDRCNGRMAQAVAIQGCAEVEQEYMSCATEFFGHIAQHYDCRPPSPSYRLWNSLATYCRDSDTRMTALGCPSPF